MAIKFLNSLNADSGVLYVDADNNRVGIGTTSPSEKLEVDGIIKAVHTDNAYTKLRGTGLYFSRSNSYLIAETNNSLSLNIGDSTSRWANTRINSAYIKFENGSTENMRITSSGNVGIGTTAPSSKLHIEDNTPFLTLRGTDASYSNAGIQLISGHATNARALGVFHYVENSDVEWFAGLPYSSNDQYVINRNTGFTVPSSQSSPPGIGASQGRLLTINAAGNVGIGTTSPSTDLEIGDGLGTRNVRIYAQTSIFKANTSGTGEAAIYLADNDREWRIQKKNNGNNLTIRDNTQGSDVMTFEAVTGNVGIGTTSPSYKLHVLGDASVSTWLYVNNIYPTSSTNDILINTGAGRTITINPTSTGKTVIPNGNVGIGTTSPSAKLHVYNAGNSFIKIDSDATAPYMAGVEFLRSSVNGGRIYNDGGAVQVKLESYFGYDSANPTRGGFMFKTAPVTSGTLVDAVRIDARGYVGIGTASPSSALDVSGNILISGGDSQISFYAGSQAGYRLYRNSTTMVLRSDGSIKEDAGSRYQINTNGSERFRVDSNGNVGIGTTSPSYKLDVAGEVRADAYRIDLSATTQRALSSTGTDSLQVGDAGVNDIKFKNAAGTSFILNSSGNVGIGITSPAYKLEVIGTTASDAISSNVGFNVKTVTPPDTTNTTVTLVSGTELTVGKVYYSITYYNALGQTSRGTFKTIDITSGNQRVQLSNIPISSDPSVIGRKIYRSKVGESSSYGALVATIADNTTTSHLDTLPETDSAFSGHVFSRSIYYLSNTTANWISTNDVRSLIVDPNLTTLGVDAGSSITRAGSSTLIGYQAGRNITYGNGNTLVGSRAGLLISTGAQNTLIGDSSGSAITTGSYNIALGPQTLHNATGSHNIAMGYYTARSLSGNRNILLGGYIGDSAVSFNESVIIGVSASATTGVNGQVNINNLIFGNKNSQVVGIGTSNPGASLHVASTTSDFVAKFSHTTATGYAPGSILLQAGQSTSRGQGLFHYNTEADESWFTGVPYAVTSKKWIVANKPDTTFNPDVAQLSHALMTIDSDTGNVGIGTTSPLQKLAVDGNIQLPNGGFIYGQSTGNYLKLDNASYVELGYSSTTAIRADGSNVSIRGTGGQANVTVTSSGNVGIGTTSPAYKLHVQEGNLATTSGSQLITARFGAGLTNASNLEIKDVRTADGNDWTSAGKRIQMKIDTTHMSYIQFNGDGNNYGMSFGTGGTTTAPGNVSEAMRIVQSGNVGIGTTSPSQKLHVGGNVRITGALYDSNNSAGTSGQVLSSTATGTDWVSLSEIQGVDGSGTANYIAKWSDTDTISNSVIYDNGTNVGIGTTAPTYKLDVAGTGRFTGNVNIYKSNAKLTLESQTSSEQASIDVKNTVLHARWILDGDDLFRVYNQTSAFDAFAIKSSGNVGIGTISPSEKLEVSGNIKATKLLLNTANNAYTLYSNGESRINDVVFASSGGADYIQKSAGTGAFYVRNNLAGKLALFGANNTSSQFTNYVGVNGGTNSVTIRTNDSDRLTVNGSGNVGIGTTSPSTKLHIAGGTDAAVIRLENTSTALSAGDTLGAIQFYNNDSTDNSPNIASSIYAVAGPSGGSGQLRFRTKESGVESGSATDTMTLTNGGNVGIGTTSPSDLLTVDGDARITGTLKVADGAYNSPSIAHRADEDTGIYFPANDTIAISTSAAERMRITSAGNVGIGTTSPQTNLDVFSGTGGTLRLGTSDTVVLGGDTIGRIEFFSSDATNTNSGLGAFIDLVADGDQGNFNPNGDLRFGTSYASASAATTRMTIKGNGNVGIGTTTPSRHLHIHANTGSAYLQLTQASTGITDNDGFQITMGVAQVNFINRENGNMVFETNNTEKLRITSSGNVGIGTTSPVGRLEVVTTDANRYIRFKAPNGEERFQFYTGGTGNPATQHMYNADGTSKNVQIAAGGTSYFNGGNVGIGTSSPNHRLDIYSNENVPLRIHRPSNANLDSSGAWGIGFSTRSDAVTSSTDTRAGIFSYYNGNLFLATNNTSIVNDPDAYARLTIASAGNVGIGTMSPSEKLHVTGTILSDQAEARIRFNSTSGTGRAYDMIGGNDGKFYFYDRTATSYRYVIDSSGNVGIGTTSPADLLHIQNTDAAIRLQDSDGTNQWSRIRQAGSNLILTSRDGTSNGQLYFQQYDGTTTTDAMVIRSSGNVGIGTTNPLEKLHVNGAIKLDQSANVVSSGIAHHTNGYLYVTGGTAGAAIGNDSYSSAVYAVDNGSLELYAGSSNRLHITSAGNVGIGTTSPSYKLEVQGDFYANGTNGALTTASSQSNLYLLNLTRTTTSLITAGKIEAGGDLEFTKADGIQIKAKESMIFTIDSDNNDTSRVFQFKDGDGDVLMTIGDTGNVGIGTTSPLTKLDVNGATKIGGKTTYTKAYASLSTTGNAVAGLGTSGNGASARLVFEIHGGAGEYQRVVYSCYNASGNWYPKKVIDEGTNAFDVTDSGNATTVTFTFKARTASQAYTPYVTIEHVGAAIDTQYL